MFIFEIFGTALPQKHAIAKGRIYTPKAMKEYIEKIQWQIRPYAPVEPLKGPVQVDITCYFEVPKSVSSTRRKQMLNQVIHHTTYPDIDNCTYVIKNAMKKIVYEDDRQIIDDNSHKRYGEIAKTVIKVIPIEEIAPTRGEICG